MLEKHQLTGPNFNELFRALKLVVRTEKLHDFFETTLPPAPAAGADAQALEDWVVLFDPFVQNYNMQSMEKTISEVHSLLIEFAKSIKSNKQPIVGASSTPQVMAIQGGRVQNKMTRKPFSHKTEKVKDVLGLNHTDVFGPLRHVLKKYASYFITFTDDYSRYGYVYLLKHKHEVFETFKVFKSEVENQLEKAIKAIRSDRGGEYISQEFKDYLKACGIVQQLTPSYTPHHNGVSERRNRTLLNMVRSMMSLAILSLSFWDYALEFTARILNMVPTKKVDKTPYELWHGKVPNLSYLKEIGRIIELEDKDILPSENTSEHPIEEEGLAPIVSQEEDVILIRRSVRTHKAPDRLCLNVEIDPDRLCFNVEVKEHSLGDLNEPANYKAALSNPEFEKWLVPMNAEMQSMYDNKVWRLVVLPPNAKVVKKMKRMQNVPYASALGFIMYVEAFAQSITSRFQ
nr:retrotransposon protein, putative, Ty1-copia subclass [Tanacetum cinerariifolium]